MPGPGLLSAVLWAPVAGAVMIATLERENRTGVRAIALLCALVTFGLGAAVALSFEGASGGLQLVEEAAWIPGLDIHYGLGVDGISLLLVLLTTFITPVVILASFDQITERLKEFYIALLVLQTGMLGVFLATDLFLFYVFWEAMLLPMVLIIGVWGGKRRIYAAVKFFLFTMVGSLLMLLAVLYIYHVCDTSRIAEIPAALAGAGLSATAELLLFGAFALSFAIKVPMFPFHTWLPDAHVEAPTAGSVVLAGVLLKMGTYGFVRFCLPMFPVASQQMGPLLCALGVVGIVYGAFLALAQSDLKKLVAYSSISHLGFVVLGIFAAAISTGVGRTSERALAGAIITMVAHGLSAGGLFLLVGMVYDRRHTREIGAFGGLAARTPRLAVMLVIVSLASIGLPGLSGFVGEFLILLGTVEAHPLGWVLAAGATTGVVLGAVYMLYMLQRVLFGPLDKPENQALADLTGRERLTLLPLVIMMFVIGLAPGLFVAPIERSCRDLLDGMRSGAAALRAERAVPAHGRLAAPTPRRAR